VAWPLPAAEAGPGKRLPVWWAERLEAERLAMRVPDLQAWCWHGAGAYYLPRYRVAWRIEAAGERQRWDEAERKAKQPTFDKAAGWMGGDVDPEDSVAGWDDDGDPTQ
jgi:hypothetical protein